MNGAISNLRLTDSSPSRRASLSTPSAGKSVRAAGKYLKHPNGPRARQRWEFVESQVRFLLWWYAVDEDGNWLFHHGVRRLSKGSGKVAVRRAHGVGGVLLPRPRPATSTQRRRAE